MKSKIEAKIPPKIMKMKNGAAHRETRFNPKHSYIEANQRFTRCGNHPNILPLKIGEISHFSHLFTKTWDTPTP
jgi:hypothetical protein